MNRDTVDVGQTFVALAGPVGANKRVFSKRIGAIIKSPTVKFSAYLLEVAQRNNIPASYQALQDLGMDVIDEQGWPGFCHNVLRNVESHKDAVLIDGLRHVLALKHLQTLSRPHNVIVVYVDASRDAQVEHLRDRGEPDAEIQKILMHPVENESTTVRRMADFIIRNESEAQTTADGIEELLSKKLDRQRSLIYKMSGIDLESFDEIYSDFERYESLRAVVRLVGSVAGDESVRDWLRTPQYDLGKRTPIEVLKYGDPDQAIASAVRLVEI
jgi:hypothetical protein